jgi:hypothetical protein
MNIRPRPLMCEILSGFTLFGLLLWSYFRANPTRLDWILHPPSNISPIIVGFSAVGFLVSWIIGNFLNMFRNLLEHLIDRLSSEPLNWDFFLKAEREKVDQLYDYFYSYYCLDFNFALGIVLLFISEVWLPLPLMLNLILLGVLIALIISAGISRCEIKRLIKNRISLYPHHGVYVRLKPSTEGIGGVGVFAIRDIPKVTKIFGNDDSKMFWVDKADIKNIDPELKKLYDDFSVIKKNGKYGCPKNFNMLTVGWYINESKENPNVLCIYDYDFVALKDIKKGEELTVDYSTYSEYPDNL